MHFKLTVAATFACSSLSLAAANWPSWRGPTQDNVSPESKFPTTWSRKENAKWRASLPEPGNSSPIVSGGTVFVTQPVRDGQGRTPLAFDRAIGQPRWHTG